jgi:hypothetical protein
MAQGGVLGFGTKVGFSTTSPVSWTKIPQVLELTPPSLEAETVDITVHGTLPYRRSMRGLIRAAQMQMTLLADMSASSVHRTLKQMQESGVTVWWRIEAPEDRPMTQWAAMEFQGVVSRWEHQTPIDDAQKIVVTVDPDASAFVTYDPGASQLG